MSDAVPPDALTLLAYTLDEMRETASLLPDKDLSRATTRPWWRNFIFGVFVGVVRSKAEVSAGLSLQYLGENIDRARDHWREALSPLRQLRLDHPNNDLVNALLDDLDRAGLDDVLPQLQHDSIPQPIARTAAHLAGVVATIRHCDDLILKARSKLLLQRMRNEPVD
jgi:hypothetical protein